MDSFRFRSNEIFNGSNGPLSFSVDSAFVFMIKPLISSKFKSRRAFVRVAEPANDEESSQAYLGSVIAGKRPVPLDRVEAWADALDLKGNDRRRFLLLAAITHIPKPWQADFVRVLDRAEYLEGLIRRDLGDASP